MFNADIHMAHTLADTIRSGRDRGIGVCIDLHACWMEGGLARTIGRAMPITGLVQVSDYVLGDRARPAGRCRATARSRSNGCSATSSTPVTTGVFDLELVGPRIEAEGARRATTPRSGEPVEMLTKLGA